MKKVLRYSPVAIAIAYYFISKNAEVAALLAVFGTWLLTRKEIIIKG